jgi:hypothetical protein
MKTRIMFYFFKERCVFESVKIEKFPPDGGFPHEQKNLGGFVELMARAKSIFRGKRANRTQQPFFFGAARALSSKKIPRLLRVFSPASAGNFSVFGPSKSHFRGFPKWKSRFSVCSKSAFSRGDFSVFRKCLFTFFKVPLHFHFHNPSIFALILANTFYSNLEA